jgi:hypothetical protein
MELSGGASDIDLGFLFTIALKQRVIAAPPHFRILLKQTRPQLSFVDLMYWKAEC